MPDLSGIPDLDALTAPASHRLRALLDRLGGDRLSLAGRATLRADVARAVRTLAALAAEPGPDGPLDHPIVICGLPRAATTALQHRLAQHPSVAGLPLATARDPFTDPAVAASDTDRWIGAITRRGPELRALHRMDTALPDECRVLLEPRFTAWGWHVTFPLDEDFVIDAAAPDPDTYRWWAAALGRLSPDRRWLLKNPGHLAHLDDIAAVTDGATFVYCDRDPRDAVRSYAALLHASRALTARDADERAALRVAAVDLMTGLEAAAVARAPVVAVDAFADVELAARAVLAAAGLDAAALPVAPPGPVYRSRPAGGASRCALVRDLAAAGVDAFSWHDRCERARHALLERAGGLPA